MYQKMHRKRLSNIDNIKFITSLSEKRMIFPNYSMTLQINLSMPVVTLPGDLVDLVQIFSITILATSRSLR